jgi:uncharacterized protein YndB with AHSA1/START domain
MIEAHAETTFDAPIETVFDAIADATNEPAWLPGAQKVEKETAGPVGLGSRFKGTYARAGEVALEIVDYERPNRVTFRAKSRIVEFDDEVRLTGDGTRTKLEARMLARPRGLMRLLTPLMAGTMRTQFEQNWPHLGGYLERQAPT